ncbi:MAG TPA: hypothetical protein VJ890_21140 [Vineibacter sp.]|nr:hypothetical protein [Vineibacter sp.]
MTLLVLTPEGVPPYSARGLTQTLTPIQAAANYRRTVNGNLLDLSLAQFRKYASTISCDDQESPAMDAVPIGAVVEVDCVAELAYLTTGGAPAKPVVTGSSRVSGEHTMYRPKLVMMVTAKSQETNEWGAAVSWSVELEEV